MDYSRKVLDKPYIQFICHPHEFDTPVNSRVTIEVLQKDLSRDDMVEVLEDFMRAMGYTFRADEYLSIEVMPK